MRACARKMRVLMRKRYGALRYVMRARWWCAHVAAPLRCAMMRYERYARYAALPPPWYARRAPMSWCRAFAMMIHAARRYATLCACCRGDAAMLASAFAATLRVACRFAASDLMAFSLMRASHTAMLCSLFFDYFSLRFSLLLRWCHWYYYWCRHWLLSLFLLHTDFHYWYYYYADIIDYFDFHYFRDIDYFRFRWYCFFDYFSFLSFILFFFLSSSPLSPLFFIAFIIDYHYFLHLIYFQLFSLHWHIRLLMSFPSSLFSLHFSFFFLSHFSFFFDFFFFLLSFYFFFLSIIWFSFALIFDIFDYYFSYLMPLLLIVDWY